MVRDVLISNENLFAGELSNLEGNRIVVNFRKDVGRDNLRVDAGVRVRYKDNKVQRSVCSINQIYTSIEIRPDEEVYVGGCVYKKVTNPCQYVNYILPSELLKLIYAYDKGLKKMQLTVSNSKVKGLGIHSAEVEALYEELYGDSGKRSNCVQRVGSSSTSILVIDEPVEIKELPKEEMSLLNIVNRYLHLLRVEGILVKTGYVGEKQYMVTRIGKGTTSKVINLKTYTMSTITKQYIKENAKDILWSTEDGYTSLAGEYESYKDIEISNGNIGVKRQQKVDQLNIRRSLTGNGSVDIDVNGKLVSISKALQEVERIVIPTSEYVNAIGSKFIKDTSSDSYLNNKLKDLEIVIGANIKRVSKDMLKNYPKLRSLTIEYKGSSSVVINRLLTILQTQYILKSINNDLNSNMNIKLILHSVKDGSALRPIYIPKNVTIEFKEGAFRGIKNVSKIFNRETKVMV